MPAKALSSSSRAELRAIKWFTLTPALGLALFALLIATFLWYLNRVGLDQQRQTLYRDIEWAQQSIRLALREDQDEIVASAPDWALADQLEDTRARGRDFLLRNPDVMYLARVGADRKILWMLPGRGVVSVTRNRTPGAVIEDSAGYGVYHEARASRRPVFSEPFLGEDNELTVELHVPILREGVFSGTIVAGYSLGRILTEALSPEVRERYQIHIVDQGGNPLVSSSPRTIHEMNLGYELPLDPPGHGIRLRAFAFDTRPSLVRSSLVIAVVGLSVGSAVSLVLLWRHARRRIAAEGERDRLFELSQDLMCVFDGEGNFLRVNPAFDLLFGATGSGRTLFDLVHPDDRAQVREALAQAAGPRPGAIESIAIGFEARFPGGDQWRWLHWSARSDEGRRGVTWYAVAHDVTERRNVETALAAETSFRQAMEDSMLTGMRAFDMEGRVTYVNPAFCEMVGFDAAELVGAAPPFPYWDPEQRTADQHAIATILAGKAPAGGFEGKVHRKDGSIRFVRMYVSPLVARDGTQTGWMTSMTDITEPKRIREELAAAHERFTTVLDELEAAVCVLPPAAGPGTTPADAIAPLFTNRTFRHLFEQAADFAPLLKATEDSAPGWLPREVLLPRLGRWYEVRARRIRWVDGRPVRMVVATDVSRRHEAEEQHRQQEEKLQRTSRLVTMGEMASSLAHELNQPLTAIANYCMGLSARIRTRVSSGQQLDAPELLEMLGKTAAQAERAGMVIRRIREFVKRSEPERRPCEVDEIVADAIGLAEIDAQRLGVRIQVDLAPGLPTLNVDPILIEQVLLNLAKNGIDAMRNAPGPVLRISVRTMDGAIDFSVADTGPGLTPEARAKLFEPFFTT
ncbi:MAG TPA: PAS domain S-box protein, partial [Quisquiliibacterium sp.]|nr:PAS domain S-box protein [Quisquiliibacterium sp.]